jgi:O-antigen/teichoic acid export membrane protein
VPVFFGLSAIAPELVPILMGSQWSISIVPLSILSLALPLRMVEHVIDIFLQASGKAGTHLGNMLFGVAVTAVAVLIGAQWGLAPASMAWTVATSVLFLFVLARSARVTAISVGAILAPLVRALAAGVVMYGAVALGRRLLPEGLDPFIEAAALVATGAAVYSAAIWVIARDDVQELLALTRLRSRHA